MIVFGLNNDTSKKIVKLVRHVNFPVECVKINDFDRELIMSYFSRKKDVIDRTISMTLKYKQLF